MKLNNKMLVTMLVLCLGLSVNYNASELTDDSNQVNNAPVNPTSDGIKVAAPTDVVTITDSNLEQEIIDQLATDGTTVTAGSITVADMESLTSLVIEPQSEEEQISDLTGLQYAINLETLDIDVYDYGRAEISDISPLSGLINLQYLNLTGNVISDISPLSGLVNLQYLDLSMNLIISDLNPLSTLINLTYLDLGSNSVSDLSPLSGLVNLEYLDLSVNDIVDLSPLSGLTNLKTLCFYRNFDFNSDISPLSSLTNLIYLDLDNSYISDLSPLSSLTNLTELRLNENYISDISPLSSLTNLTKLQLGNNLISDISPLSSLINLTELYLEANRVSDLSPLSGLVNLKYLDLSSNDIVGISPLSELVNLEYLYLRSNDIVDLSPLSSLTNLTELWLDENNISELSPLSGLTNLTKLQLDRNKISNLNPLSGLINLKSLAIDYNEISDLSPLSNLSAYIDAYYQKIEAEEVSMSDTGEVFYNIVDIDGNEVPVSVGILEADTIRLTGDFSLSLYDAVAPARGEFSGTVAATFTIEEKELTDEELIDLFEVYAYYPSDITVDQSSVDYSTPGEYTVIFDSKYPEDDLVSTLKITDVLPVLSIDNSEVTIPVGSSLDDIIALIGYSATEIADGDLTDSVVVDDSKVDYKTVGTYEVVLTVTDEEGNVATETVNVVVSEDDAGSITTDSEVTSETSEAAASEVEASESDNNKMSLATTGSIASITVIIGLIAIIGLSKIKTLIK